jgi:hypothetical protein
MAMPSSTASSSQTSSQDPPELLYHLLAEPTETMLRHRLERVNCADSEVAGGDEVKSNSSSKEKGKELASHSRRESTSHETSSDATNAEMISFLRRDLEKSNRKLEQSMKKLEQSKKDLEQLKT